MKIQNVIKEDLYISLNLKLKFYLFNKITMAYISCLYENMKGNKRIIYSFKDNFTKVYFFENS